MLVLALLASTDPAHAGANVVYGDDAEEAVRHVAADTGLPVWDVHPTAAADLASGDAPQAVGAGQVPGCIGSPVTNAQIRDVVAKVETRIAWQDTTALADLAAADASLACLSEPAEASLGGRLFFLYGIAAGDAGLPDQAQAAFARALTFQPSLAWDTRFSPKLRTPFDAALASTAARAKRQVTLGPGVEGAATLWIDGQLVQVASGRVEVSDGLHLVQVLLPKVSTFPLVASERAVAIVVPSALSVRAVAEAAEPSRQAVLQPLIEQRFAADDTTYVWTGARTWKAGSWDALPPSNAMVEERHRAVGQRLLLAGGTTGGAGLVAVASGLALWAANHDANGAETTREYGSRMARTGAGSALVDAGVASLGAGLACVAIGVAW